MIALDDAVRTLAREEQELLTINPDSRYHIRQLSVPIFDVSGAVRLSFVLVMLGEIAGSRLLDVAAALGAAAAAMTRSIGGTLPDALVKTDY